MAFLAWVLAAAEAYLLGGIDTGILISKYILHDDVRNHGSGAAGMTNMLRTFGKKAAAATAAGDVCKGIVAVFIGRAIFNAFGLDPLFGASFAAVLAIIGHWKPLFFNFKGGKGVLVAAGGILAMRPVLVFPLAAVFLGFFLPTRMVSLGSIMVAISYPIFTLIYCVVCGYTAAQTAFVSVCALICGLLVVYMHRANIKRIREGKEYRFDGSHKKA